jgi:hypothetical protein
VERPVERLESFAPKSPRHIVDADSKIGQSLQHAADFLDIFFEPGFQLSVVSVSVKAL